MEVIAGEFCAVDAEIGQSFLCCRATAAGIDYTTFRRSNITAARKIHALDWVTSLGQYWRVQRIFHRWGQYGEQFFRES
eukprot:12582196-Ditylum_brightwellii.AAC.1